jgi:Zn-dependent protease with chaperone function
MVSNPLHKDLIKTVLLSLLSFFLLPALTILFVHNALPGIDKSYLEVIERHIVQDPRLDLQSKEEAKSFYQANPPSSTCNNNAPDIAKYRAGVCAPYTELWQFKMADKVSSWAIKSGALVLLIVCALGALAFVNRSVQYLSFVAGWRLLSLTSAVEVVIQGSLAVWLSFWVTAYYFERYSVKLIGVIGICAAIAMFYAIVYIFKRPPNNNVIEGELVSEADAPKLWELTRALAAKLKTAAPAQIIAGIDANFFVTETPLVVGNQTVTGRSLYVSIPLLRLLGHSEAGAVLAHELAHLRGGDTASSAALGPKLVQYDHYCYMMRSGGITILVYYLLRMYRMIFEFALKRDSREREFLADRIAAKVVSPSAIVQSLIKIAAYAGNRGQIERTLFEQNQQHGNSLGIAQFVASGLAPYASSPEFLDDLAATNIPHPFDSHPSLQERMQNVEHMPDENTFGKIVTATPQSPWADDIQTAADIEQRLWSAYEQRFAAAHEQNLAYRYEPKNDAELAIVLKYFPPVIFPLKGDKAIEITYQGIICPGEAAVLSWDNVTNFSYEDGYGGDVLKIEHPEKSWLGAKTTKVKLPGIRKQREQFKAVLGHYWQRHQIMRQQ